MEVIDEWIDDVHAKLEDWNPRNAQRFVTPAITTDLGLSISGPLMGRSDLNEYPELRRLHGFRNVFRGITDQ